MWIMQGCILNSSFRDGPSRAFGEMRNRGVGGGGGHQGKRRFANTRVSIIKELERTSQVFSHATWNTNKYALFNGVSQSFWVYEYLRETVERESVNSVQHRR